MKAARPRSGLHAAASTRARPRTSPRALRRRDLTDALREAIALLEAHGYEVRRIGADA